MDQIKKKHHYLPQFYVDGFTNDKREVFVFDKETLKINKQGKNGTFHKNKFYTVDFSKYEKRDNVSAQKIRESIGIEDCDIDPVVDHPNMVEDLLGLSESISAPIIKKMIKGESISKVERIEISTFVALMYTRNPLFHEFISGFEKRDAMCHIETNFSSKESIQNIYDELVKDGYQKKIDVDAILNTVKEKRFTVEIPRELRIEKMVIASVLIDQLLENKTWYLLRSPKDSSFISNDNPVFLDHPNIHEIGLSGLGFGTLGVRVIFPLSKECLLMMQNTPRDGSLFQRKIDRVEVRNLNKLIFNRAAKHVFSRDESLMLSLVKRQSNE